MVQSKKTKGGAAMPNFNLKIAGQVGAVECGFDSTPYYLGRYATNDAAGFSVVSSFG